VDLDALRAYQKTIIDTYDARSANFDKSEWHRRCALRLLNSKPPSRGQRVLDIATGTGAIALQAARLVGPAGLVTGIDLSSGMLQKAKQKCLQTRLENVSFELANAEQLEFADASFDRIYCASAFFWMLDPVETLIKWRQLLKDRGIVGFHAIPETSYVYVTQVRRALASQGIDYRLNMSTASVETCYQLMKQAGYTSIDIRVEKNGFYLTLEAVKAAWLTADDFSPGQHPNPLVGVSQTVLDAARQDYFQVIESLNTKNGVWNDITMYYVYGEKTG